ncbi:MAG: hypothetical protein FJ118_03090 [Deltaproteobacteria bacterium]|nr:hypothetical protein [Deltaproteobacteria bacterium]
MNPSDRSDLAGFLEALGYDEEPMGMFYTDREPARGYAPKPGRLPSVEVEARKEVDFQGLWRDFSCVIGQLWIARKRRGAAYFDHERFGCLGGAFFLGFLKPQLDFIVHYVSTGIPGVIEGERYLPSPEVTRAFYEHLDPRPAPRRFCVFKPLSQFAPDEKPELVIFFARPETISGLHQLATFVTSDLEAVQSPFGAGCANMVTWPIKFLQQGKLKAVLGGWDPSERRFVKADELTFTVPYEMFVRMLEQWPQSFLTADAWSQVKKRILRSKKAWGEGD